MDTVHYLVQLALQNIKTRNVCKVTKEKIFTFLLHIMQPGENFGQALSVL